ncbi:MAG: hypothetical protein R3C52_09305 [Hyphomonadaceae bacterium]
MLHVSILPNLLRGPAFAGAVAATCALAGACGQGGPLLSDASDTPDNASATCDTRLDTDWSPHDGVRLSVSALTMGETCRNAVAVLVVRDEAGAVLLAAAQPTADTFGLQDAANGTAMREALREWVRQDNSVSVSKDLPEWKRGADNPAADSEFPFFAESWIDQPYYEDLRRADLPVFAYPQGLESMAVMVLREGVLERVGVQVFPG